MSILKKFLGSASSLAASGITALALSSGAAAADDHSNLGSMCRSGQVGDTFTFSRDRTPGQNVAGRTTLTTCCQKFAFASKTNQAIIADMISDRSGVIRRMDHYQCPEVETQNGDGDRDERPESKGSVSIDEDSGSREVDANAGEVINADPTQDLIDALRENRVFTTAPTPTGMA